MNVRMIVENDVLRPIPDPIPSTLYDYYTPVEMERFGLRNNVGLWPSYNTLDTFKSYPLCPDPDDLPTHKTFDSVDWVSAAEFVNYAGVQCQAVGLDIEDQKSEVRRVYEANEAKTVERGVFNTLFTSPGGSDEHWSAPVDVTPYPTVTPSLLYALAALEGYAAAVYVGLPTIWMSRYAASLLGDRIVWRDGKAYTRNGSKIVMGGGLDKIGQTPGGDTTPPMDVTMFATGDVYIERSPLIHVQSTVIPGDGNGIGSDQTGIEENAVVTLVERMFRVAVDGFVASASAIVYNQ